MIQIGRSAKLEVVKEVDFGVYLDAKELGQVLLPNKFVPKNTELGNMLDVFIYLDSQDMVIATTKHPVAEVGQFALLKVVATGPFGAFLDWGLEKDLLLPFGEQKRPVEEGQTCLVYIDINKADERIVASSKLDKFLDNSPAFYKAGEQVELLIAGTTELGYKAIINNHHWGVIYKNEVFKKLRFGQRTRGYIKQIRQDGKIDLQLQKGGKEELDQHAKSIVRRLQSAAGFLPLTDKTNADVIYAELAMSKKAFKKSIGGLYKKGMISIDSDGIRLTQNRE
ncbi:CvfB family protein [Shewanella gelidii]|uniref:GntR family transcriptional regulator n=1 Tax=Shewanella gelidii TaxID=1642821 RepID=A0A917JWB0_9GAMM|nr:S1-like domain-containing RNA-binding protein [Shewanella gelidii]MCL1098974.1 S1-like domain-containing RNA-binding protein [Shewanella gelidii]GGI89201.1 GntR family transcriptional regulator [Shewanella gelidii]